MNIGINASFLMKPMTGIGQVTRVFLTYLAKHPDFSQHTWYLYTDGELSAEQKTLLPEKSWQWRPVHTWWQRQDIPHQYLFESQALPKAMRQETLDVFLSLYQSATILPPSVKHVMLVHDMIPKLFPEYLQKWTSRFHYKKILQAVQQAAELITPSVATQEDIKHTLGVSSEKITAIPLGIEPYFFNHLNEKELHQGLEKYGLAPGYLYHGGGIEIRKNTEAVLRAYKMLVDKTEESIPPLVVSGKIHAESNLLATPVLRLVQELGLKGRVKLLGLVPGIDLPLLYQGASLFLFPSRYEGFGLPVLEAYASGTPVITTQAGSLKELTDEGEALIVSSSTEVSIELAQHIQTLLIDPEQAELLRTRGLEKAKHYSWQRFTGGVVEALLQ